MRAFGSILVRVLGVGLVLSALLKLVAFESVATWFAGFSGWGDSWAAAATVGLIAVECMVGGASAMLPRLVAPVAAALFAIFLAVHAALATRPEIMGCPCLGDVVDGAGGWVQGGLIFASLLGMASNLSLFAFSSRSMSQTERSMI